MSSENYEKRTSPKPVLDSSKVNLDNFYKNLSKKKIEQLNKDDLSNFTLDEIEQLVTFTIQNFNNNQYSSSISSNKNGNSKKFIPNNVSYGLGYDLSNFTMEELAKLVNLTIQHFRNNNKY